MPGNNQAQKLRKVAESSDDRSGPKKTRDKGPKLKPNAQGTSLGSKFSRKRGCDRPGEGKANARRRRTIVKKAILQKTKSLKKQPSSSSQKNETVIISTKNGAKHDGGDVDPQRLNRRKKRKRRKGNVELDEASRLQRRTKYLLIKVKLEQNLIDAYSTEGWKGQSREKIKPEKELERAKVQILKCKLGIREAICQLDVLSSEGRIDDSAVAPDGSVYHEHIICAKCKLREAFPDNDIILCDGTCNRAFHQKCLDPPLSTENIPPGDEGWFCRYCKSKMEILEATNAHLGTNFAMDSNWQDIFKEEAILLDGRESLLCEVQEWPSDDSEDVDYDPEESESSIHKSMNGFESDDSNSASSSSSLRLIEDDAFFLLERADGIQKGYEDHFSGVESDRMTDCEVLCQPRQRKAVDYIKLNDELFGKIASLDEQLSEDEDWGPAKRKRGKDSGAMSTLGTSDENESNCTKEKTTEVKKKLLSGKTRRPIFRFPHNVVEKLRLVFAENELPSRSIRDNLSKQLGLESEKVNKWFKNARYLALKSRKKAKRSNPISPRKESLSGMGKDKLPDRIPSRDVALRAVDTPKDLKRSCRKQAARLLASTLKRKRKQHMTTEGFSAPQNMAPVDFGDDVSLKLLREKVKMEKKLSFKRKNSTLEAEAEAEMERLCRIEDKVEKLQQVLLRFPNCRTRKADVAALDEPSVIYVPVAVVKEKG